MTKTEGQTIKITNANISKSSKQFFHDYDFS